MVNIYPYIIICKFAIQCALFFSIRCIFINFSLIYFWFLPERSENFFFISSWKDQSMFFCYIIPSRRDHWQNLLTEFKLWAWAEFRVAKNRGDPFVERSNIGRIREWMLHNYIVGWVMQCALRLIRELGVEIST